MCQYVDTGQWYGLRSVLEKVGQQALLRDTGGQGGCHKYGRQDFPTPLLFQIQFKNHLPTDRTCNDNPSYEVTTCRGQARCFQKVERPSLEPEPLIGFSGLLEALARSGT